MALDLVERYFPHKPIKELISMESSHTRTSATFRRFLPVRCRSMPRLWLDLRLHLRL